MRSAALATLTLAALILAIPLVGGTTVKPSPSVHLPWKAAGLTEREAAAHLLNRFAFGPRPGEIDAVVKMGLDRWFERQLAAGLPDRDLNERLEKLPALDMSASELARTYPPPGLLLAEARRAGVIEGDLEAEPEEAGEIDKRERRAAVMRWASSQGYRSQRELAGQLMTQKLWRAVESENQLAEVLTDFWFNHFNVSLTDNQSRSHLLAYERDAIRPNAARPRARPARRHGQASGDAALPRQRAVDRQRGLANDPAARAREPAGPARYDGIRLAARMERRGAATRSASVLTASTRTTPASCSSSTRSASTAATPRRT